MINEGHIRRLILDRLLEAVRNKVSISIDHPLKTKFVVHEHWATTHHFDLRIKRDKVLVSWAIPKRKFPKEAGKHVLAIQTNDHPLSWYNFKGNIPAGEYGAGHVEIYDKGKCTIYKWTNTVIIVEFFGEKVKGFYSLVKTNNSNWLLVRMNQERAMVHYKI